MPKKKLLLVVGAGASVKFDIPSVAAIRGIISSAIQTRYPLLHAPATNLYEHIEETVSRYWTHFVPAHLRRPPHFEDLLYTIFALAAAYPAGAYTSALGALITATKLLDMLFFSKEPQQVGPQTLHDLGNASVDAMIENFRSTCVAAQVSKAAKFAQLQAFVAALQAEFQIAVVTLNYDDVMYRAFWGIETGFDPITGKFDEGRILNRLGWPCMLHLHGSVHFDMPLPTARDLYEIYWQERRGSVHPGTPNSAAVPKKFRLDSGGPKVC
jgi:SIR2-like domain